ncbi:putative RNA methyltransferase [Ruthenibacterium lactatiformans]|uniref:putative RNA methyltransferase n=1 Tax=Ruthenibacterium lactatiformans TaxID=1550024 RepID=UPI0026844164
MELFRCPVCGAPLTRGARVLVCPKRHSFDLAAEGYAHLLPAAQMHAKIPGDSREMVAARRRFLDTGGYACFSDGLNALVCSLLMELPAPSLVDAGCGEGYYTARLVQALRASGKTPSAAAFDISKFAVKAAARRDKAHAVQWAWPAASPSRWPMRRRIAWSIFSARPPHRNLHVW